MIHLVAYLADTSVTSGLKIPHTAADSHTLQNILNFILALSGAIAVLVIALAGLSFITAGGDPGRISRARSAILYAVIGLVVAAMGGVIVNFVLSKT